MKNEPQTPPSQALALERFALIAKIQDLLRQGFPLTVALEQVSCCPLTLPDGTQRLYTPRTIEDWWYDYQLGGFAALTPKQRSDKGQPRTLTPQQQKWILEQAQAHLAVPIKVSAGVGANKILNCLRSIRSIGCCVSTNCTPTPAVSNYASLWAEPPNVSRRPSSTICG